MTSPSPRLAEALLRELEASGGEASLPRLCKRLGLRMSVLMRLLAVLGDGVIGGIPGPGQVAVHEHGDRRLARITEAGRAWLADMHEGRGQQG